MKARIKTVFLMFVLLSCFSVKAQDRLGDCLMLDMPQLLFGYDERLAKILHENLGEDFLFRCIYMPAYDPEWVVQLEKDPGSELFQLYVLSFGKNLWYQKDGEVEVTKIVVPIEDSQASGLANLVNLFIKNKSSGLRVGCLDGESIQFEINVDGDVQCGATVCPHEDSLEGRLVAVFSILKESVIIGTMDEDVFVLAKCLFNEAFSYYYGKF